MKTQTDQSGVIHYLTDSNRRICSYNPKTDKFYNYTFTISGSELDLFAHVFAEVEQKRIMWKAEHGYVPGHHDKKQG